MSDSRPIPVGSDFYLLYTTDERFRVQPCHEDGTASYDTCLNIDRLTGEMSIEAYKSERSFFQSKVMIRGVFGVINLLAGPYMIVIKDSDYVGAINQQSIFRITKTDVIPYGKSMAHLSEAQLEDNLLYLEMLNYMLNIENYYYSPTYDITHTAQRLNNTSPEFLYMPLRERADARFVWNNYMLNVLAMVPQMTKSQSQSAATFPDFVLPVMMGFVDIKELELAGHQVKLTLISRRSCMRPGVRFQTRGIDDEGNAANFIETEQIVEVDDLLCSFVQTRGSVPIFWSQKPNLRWQPWPKIAAGDHQQAFRYHIFSQSYTYGQQVLLSLLNHSGREKPVGDMFAKIVRDCALMDVRLIPIDFHKECANLNWDKISQITDAFAEDIRRFSAFVIRKSDNTEISTQTGVFRTNCMDCLDRTNVVQSLIGLRLLEFQFQRFGVLSSEESLSEYPEFISIYRNIWADNGDACSIQYAGTGALKSDFTRTGERTLQGCIQDGYNALCRWYINNYMDGFRQDAVELFVGGYSLSDLRFLTYARSRKSLANMLVPACFVFANCMLFLSFFVASENCFSCIVFWLSIIAGLLAYIYAYGELLVDLPRLQHHQQQQRNVDIFSDDAPL